MNFPSADHVRGKFTGADEPLRLIDKFATAKIFSSKSKTFFEIFNFWGSFLNVLFFNLK